jgi:hypothetical protein
MASLVKLLLLDLALPLRGDVVPGTPFIRK